MIQLAGVAAIHLYFLKQREIRVVRFLGKGFDLFVTTRFLGTELVAGKREDGATWFGKIPVGVQSTQPGVLWCQSSATGDVDHETKLACVVRKLNRLAVY